MTKPPSVQSPFAQCWRYLHWGDIPRLLGGHYSSVLAHTDSCADPIWLSPTSAIASFEKSLQVATSPCCHRDLPDVISANLSSDAWSLATAGSQSACTCFFLRAIGLPQQGCGSACPLLPANTIFRGAYFRGCRHSLMFKPPSLLTSQIVPTPAHSAAGQLRLLHPSRTCFVTSACIGYASRPNTGNWRHGDSHPARFAALSAAPPCLRFTGHFATSSAKLGAERNATPFSRGSCILT